MSKPRSPFLLARRNLIKRAALLGAGAAVGATTRASAQPASGTGGKGATLTKETVSVGPAAPVAKAADLGPLPPPPASGPDGAFKDRWLKLDAAIRARWDGDLAKATEAEVRGDKAKTLLFQPLPYITAGGASTNPYQEMYAWDTQFINQALLVHGRDGIVRDNIRNHLFMIDRYGFILNGNRTYYLTRSQTPLVAWSVESAYKKTKDKGLLLEALPRLEREFRGYWDAEHHRTPVGLSTARDLGDPGLRAELAAEAETGLDFTPLFDGDVRNCVPLIVNAALVRYADTIAMCARELGMREVAAAWTQESKKRAAKINELCWDDKLGFYFEYDHVRKTRLPYWSLLGYWMMWAGVASKSQAKRMVANLPKFELPFGLPVTAEEYASPHKEWKRLQWNHPSSWAPLQIIAVQALERYGFTAEAKRTAFPFLWNELVTWEQTGRLWERYDAQKGGPDRKKERSESYELNGWSAAAAVLLGRTLFPDAT